MEIKCSGTMSISRWNKLQLTCFDICLCHIDQGRNISNLRVVVVQRTFCKIRQYRDLDRSHWLIFCISIGTKIRQRQHAGGIFQNCYAVIAGGRPGIDRIDNKILRGCKNATMTVADLVRQMNLSVVIGSRSDIVAVPITIQNNRAIVSDQIGECKRVADISIGNAGFQVCNRDVVKRAFRAMRQLSARRSNGGIVFTLDNNRNHGTARSTTTILQGVIEGVRQSTTHTQGCDGSNSTQIIIQLITVSSGSIQRQRTIGTIQSN